MSRILIASDYERRGSVYYYDRATGNWYGDGSSISRWVRWVRAPIMLECRLKRKALEMGYCPTIFTPKPKFSDVVKKNKKVKKAVQKKSDSFIPLF